MTLLDILKDVGRLPAYLSVGTWTVIILSVVVWIVLRSQNNGQPEALPDFPIPYLSKTYRFLFKTDEFLRWAK
jgi:hypothetical protein